MKKHGAFQRLRGMVQMVSDLVFDDDGNATCTGVSDDQEEDSYSPTVAYHFGFYSRPSKARGLIIKADGQGNTSFLVGFRDKQYEITLSKGEVGVQNEFGASTLWDKNGNVVTTPGGSGKVLQGAASGTQPAVLGNSLETRLADLETQYLSHTHIVSGTNTCPAGGGAIAGTGAATTATLSHNTDNIKASKVEVK